MVKRLITQLKNKEEIKKVLNKIDIVFHSNGIKLDVLLIYLPCNGKKCNQAELFRIIKQSIMTKFALSCSEIENKLSLRRKKSPDELFTKAVRKISSHTAKGELGELLLYTLLDVYFDAPKLLSKISHKESRRVPAFGADAVHAQYVDGTLRLYLGESKMRESFSSSVTDAVESISDCIEKYSDEFDFIDSHIDFPEMDIGLKEDLLDLLDPFSDSGRFSKDMIHSPCFIGFVCPSKICNGSKCNDQKYIDIAKGYVSSYYSKLGEKMDIKKSALMLLPFSSLDELVDGFVQYMGIKK